MNSIETFQLSIYGASTLSFLISYSLCYTIIKLNKSYKFKKNDQKRLSNLNIVPLGGVAMATSFFVSVRFLGQADTNIAYISIFALGVSILGVIDDFNNLNWKLKMLFQFILVSIPIINFELVINLENLLGFDLGNNLNIIFTVFWVVVLMNSINFIDNMDGFAGINSAFICLALTLLSFVYNQNYLADVSFVLLFSILAFIFFNFPPAKIYMGDSGSLFIGFVFGFISILFDWNPTGESYLYSSIAPIFLFFTIPLLDFSTVFVHRIKNKISPATGGTDHVSHRLLNEGYTIKQVLTIFAGINLFIFFLLALSIVFEYLSLIIFIVYLISIVILFYKFQKMKPLD